MLSCFAMLGTHVMLSTLRSSFGHVEECSSTLVERVGFWFFWKENYTRLFGKSGVTKDETQESRSLQSGWKEYSQTTKPSLLRLHPMQYRSRGETKLYMKHPCSKVSYRKPQLCVMEEYATQSNIRVHFVLMERKENVKCLCFIYICMLVKF